MSWIARLRHVVNYTALNSGQPDSAAYINTPFSSIVDGMTLLLNLLETMPDAVAEPHVDRRYAFASMGLYKDDLRRFLADPVQDDV